MHTVYSEKKYYSVSTRKLNGFLESLEVNEVERFLLDQVKEHKRIKGTRSKKNLGSTIQHTGKYLVDLGADTVKIGNQIRSILSAPTVKRGRKKKVA